MNERPARRRPVVRTVSFDRVVTRKGVRVRPRCLRCGQIILCYVGGHGNRGLISSCRCGRTKGDGQ